LRFVNFHVQQLLGFLQKFTCITVTTQTTSGKKKASLSPELPMLASALPPNPAILRHDVPLGTAVAGGASIAHSPFTSLQETFVASWVMGGATDGCSTGTFFK
jgi:hypothetical protein